MKIGISLACFYPMHPEDTVERVSKLGFDTAELFINTFSELDDGYIDAFKKLCDNNNINIYSIHPFTSALENYLFFSPYDRRIEDAKYLYERYCLVAKKLGAKVINIHGDRGIGLKDIDSYAKALDPLIELGVKYGVHLSQENVFFNSVNHPEFIYKLRKKMGEGSLKFTFDIKQANKGGSDPYEVCEAMGSDVINFHINDYDDEHICMLPGQGRVNHQKLMKILVSNGYKGPALIEVYSSNFQNESEIYDSKLYLDKINSEL